MAENSKIKSFEDLHAWQQAHQLALHIYRVTEHFPVKEIYALTNQLRRAAVSIASNIAEGFSRQSLKEKIQFYHMALGSNTEIHSQLLLARDLNYVVEKEFNTLLENLITVNKLLNGLIKSLKAI